MKLAELDMDRQAVQVFIGEGHPEETRACYERIEELKVSLAEMVSIYWGEGDGIYPPPACIIRAELALAEEVLS